jgi:RNA polymerase sigma-70 factor (ECF subfamily)
MATDDEIRTFYAEQVAGRRPTPDDARHFVELLWNRHAAAVYTYMRAITFSEGEAEDATQEAFVRLHWRLLERGDEGSGRFNPRAYLRQVAANAWRDRRRRTKRERPLSRPDGEEGEVPCPDPRPDTQLTLSERLARLRDCIELLRPGDRELIRAHYLGERRYEELAEELAVEVSVVRLRVHRARQRLSRCMHEKGAA